MRFAVIGDVHSNIFALESVLKDIEERKVDFIISTGDLVGYLPFPNEVIHTIRKNKILVVQGNHDRGIAKSKPIQDESINNMSEEELHKSASSAFTNWIITAENRKYLDNLPQKLKIEGQQLTVLIVHGSPRLIGEYLYEDSEKLAELSTEIDEDIVICGHTHIPYHQIVNNKHFINAGSVGKPKHGGLEAAYVIVSLEDAEIKSEMIKVSYDIETIITAIRGNRMISDELIPMLRKGF